MSKYDEKYSSSSKIFVSAYVFQTIFKVAFILIRKQFVILLKGITSLQRKYLIAGIRLLTSLLKSVSSFSA